MAAERNQQQEADPNAISILEREIEVIRMASFKRITTNKAKQNIMSKWSKAFKPKNNGDEEGESCCI